MLNRVKRAFVLLAAGSAAVSGQVVVGVNNTTQSYRVYEPNSATVASTIAQAPSGLGVVGMAANEFARELYVCSSTTLRIVPFDSPATTTSLAFTGPLATNVSGMAYHMPSDTLYGTVVGAGGNIIQINRSTGSRTVVWASGAATLSSIDVDPQTHKIYVWKVNTTTNAVWGGAGLYEIDIVNQKATFIIGYPFKTGMTLETDIDGLAVAGGYAYLVCDEQQWVYPVNLTTSPATHETPFLQSWMPATYLDCGATYATGLLRATNDLGVYIRSSDLELVRPMDGDELTFTVTAHNNSTADSLTNVVLTAPLPAGLTFVSSTLGGLVGSDVVVTVPTLAAGASVNFQFVVQAVDVGTYNIAVTGSADEADPLPLNNVGNTGAIIVRDLGVDMFVAFNMMPAPPCAITVGSTVTFTIQVENLVTLAETTATGVQLTIELPPEVTLVSSTPAGTLAGSTLTIDLADQAPDAFAFVDLELLIGPGESFTLLASVIADQFERNPANNSVSLPRGIVPATTPSSPSPTP